MPVFRAPKRRVPADVIFPEHDEDMGDTAFHSDLINELLSFLKFYFRNRNDVLVATNLNLYFDEDDPTRWCAPDLMVVFGVSNAVRRSYKIWEEKQFPQVVFEVASEKTWRNDMADKYFTYNFLGAQEYYLLDPEQIYLPAPIVAYHRRDNRLSPATVDNQRIFSPLLNLEIVQDGKLFRLFDPQTQEFLLTLAEYEAEVQQLRAEIERLKTQK